MAKIVTVPLCDLVEDMDFYPRHAVDDANVQKLAMALEAGCELPPLIADSKSKRIVDGWHRGRAFKRVHGPGATVPVEFRSYASEAEMLEDCIRMNSTHGRQLDAMDQTRAVLMLERAGLSKSRIALVMHVPEGRVDKLRLRIATCKVPTEATVPGTKIITLKRSASHLHGKTLTKEQAQAHDGAPGTSYLLLANQLKSAVQTGLINREDERLKAALIELRKMLVQEGF